MQIPNAEHLQKLVGQIDLLQTEALALEKKFAPAIHHVHPKLKKSAKNLLHYLALRHHDIRPVQEQLAELGLSSLGRAEGHVLASLKAVRKQLCFLIACTDQKEKPVLSFSESRKFLTNHTESLLGQTPESRNTRIMVTFSNETVSDFDLVKRMMHAGMNSARINCAHENKSEWLKMIKNIRKAENGLSCKIVMDLMGPKLRTGPIKPGPELIAIHPSRDNLGQVSAAAKIWLIPIGNNTSISHDAVLPVTSSWLSQLQTGDEIKLKDTRGRKRSMTVIARKGKSVLVHLFKTSYISSETILEIKNKKLNKNKTTTIGKLPIMEIPIILKKDQILILHKEQIPGEQAQYDASGKISAPAHISCTLPDIFEQVKPGQPILFDDGAIEGEILEVNATIILVKIIYADDKGSKLRADKGINLPESDIRLSGLSAKDRRDLKFVARYADVVNLSFVNHPDMVFALQEELNKLQRPDLPVMLKIETKEGFKNLPHILLAAMRNYPTGIMIARGDLAVECGWERLAEVQEEILWLCEAAHLPVVWATQVLEKLAKKGKPSRAEITDAAMSQRADCVMLNKGPHVIQAIELLDGILKRMQKHQHKKTSMLRNLQVSMLEPITDEKESK